GQPVFREEPQNLTVVVGAAARLQCAVEGLTGETVQWAKDGLLLGPDRSLPGFPRYSMAGRQTGGEYHLKIERASLEDESLFECQVGGSESSGPLVSPPVWLTVLVPPAQCLVMVDAADEPWMFGEEYTVTCLATDAKPAAQITVFRGGVEVTEFDSSEMSGSEDKLSNTEVTVRVVAESGDNGRQFQCVANSDALLTPLKTSFTMSVLFPPQPPVIEGMDSEEVKAGTTLQLLCTSRGGNPVATLHWTKNDELLSSSWEVDKQAVVARSSVTLTVKAEDNGAQLTCESTNPASPSPLLNTITLNVVFLPSEVHVAGSLSATEGKNITLSCSTTSSRPPVLIRWWLGARQLDASSVTVTEGSHGGMVTMSNLTHTVSREENGLPLICEAFNQAVRFSRTQSNPLRVYYPPQKVWIEAPPQGTKLRSGSTLHLVCFSSGGNPPGRLTWLKDNKSAREMQTAVQSEKGVSRELVLLLQPSDNQATYQKGVVHRGQGAFVGDRRVRAHMFFPAVSVKISVTPKEVRRGQTLTLDCVAGSSNPVANISWVMGGQKLQGVPRGQQGAEFGGVSVRSRLSLQVWSAHSGRKVSCQAYSPVLAEGVNTFHTLNVLYPPEFDPDQPREVQAVEGGMALLPVKVSANPNDISYNWTHRGHFLVKERAQRHRMQPGGALEIWNVTRADAGNYTIICNNAEGENRTILCLDILYAPTITHLAVRTEADLGQPAEIVCTANANPTNPDMFSWTWLGEEEGSLSEDTQQAVQGATGRLLLPEVQRSHSGQYRCQVDNGIAPPASADVWLIVRFKPEIHKGVQWSKVASRGDGSGTAEVVCQAEGVPRVQFDWAKNGKTLDLSDPRYSEQTVRDGALHTSRVMIVNVSAALDYALFTCTASNSLGQDTLDIQLLSTDRPDPPSGLKVIGVTHHSISLQWAPGFDGGLKQSFRVRYRRKDALSSQYVDVFPPQATSFTVTGLRSATSYNLSIIALNELGESRYTDHDAMLTTVTEGQCGAGGSKYLFLEGSEL
ncbi:NPHN protein, partial [Amia calva]|nr:NPHN protein [Amia calva]